MLTSRLPWIFMKCVKIPTINLPSEGGNEVIGKGSFNNSQKISIGKNDTHIQSISAMVSTDKLKKYLNNLSNFHTRHSKSHLLNDAGNWIIAELQSLGYPDTSYQSFGPTID